MNRLDSPAASETYLPASQPPPKSPGRLIVLVPSLDLDPVLAARRLCELAGAADAQILFLGLCGDAVQEPALRRQLVLLSAMVSGGGVQAHTELMFGRGWLETVKSRRAPGDIVVCFSEHRLGPLGRPISHLLQSGLDAPLYILSGMDARAQTQPNRLAQATVWLGSLAILVGFFLLQIRIDRLTTDLARTVLVLSSICVEVWLVWFWNSQFE